MRTDWKQAPPNIKSQILLTLHDLGPYSAAHRTMALGYAVKDIDAWCPMHREFDQFMAEKDPASAYMIKNSNLVAFQQEALARELVTARAGWARDTSAADDRATDIVAIEKQRAEDRERFAVQRANEQQAQEAFRAHEARMEQARKEFDHQHPAPISATTQKAKA